MASFHPYNLRTRNGRPPRPPRVEFALPPVQVDDLETGPEEESPLSGRGNQNAASGARSVLSSGQTAPGPDSQEQVTAAPTGPDGESPSMDVEVKEETSDEENIFVSAVHTRDESPNELAPVKQPDSDASNVQDDDGDGRPWTTVSYSRKGRRPSASSKKKGGPSRALRIGSPSSDKENVNPHTVISPIDDPPENGGTPPDEPSGAQSVHLSDEQARDKRRGKQVDPRNWGAADLPDHELDQEVQDKLYHQAREEASVRLLAAENPDEQREMFRYWNMLRAMRSGTPAGSPAPLAGPSALPMPGPARFGQGEDAFDNRRDPVGMGSIWSAPSVTAPPPTVDSPPREDALRAAIALLSGQLEHPEATILGATTVPTKEPARVAQARQRG